MADEQEIRRQTADPSIAVAERMDPLEASVKVGDEQHRVLITAGPTIGVAEASR